LDYPTVNLNPR